MEDSKRVSLLLLLVIAAAVGIAGFALLLLYQVASQPQTPELAGVAPGRAALLTGGAAIAVAVLGIGLFWRNTRSLPRRAEEGEVKYRSTVEGSTSGTMPMTDVIKGCSSLEFIETIMENMPIGVSVFTFNDKMVRYMNRSMEEIIGWPREVVNDHEQFWHSAIPDPAYREAVLGKIDGDLERGDPSQMVWEVRITRRSGETAVNLWTSIPMFQRNLLIVTAQDFTEQRRAEEALRLSEMHRIQLQAELNWAAEVQRKLLPGEPPSMAGFEMAALCLPARQVGGDFYDWQETSPGTVTLAFGDIMGKGMAAAMLMAAVRAALRTVTRGHGPSAAVHLAEQALWRDLEDSERFVTLFLAQLDVASGKLTYVDCGHGYVFLRRHDGTVQELLPRGLPLGISADEPYQEGTCSMEEGDALIVYSDGLPDAGTGPAIDHRLLSERVAEATDARKMVELIAALVETGASLPDDMTILVMRRKLSGDTPDG